MMHPKRGKGSIMAKEKKAKKDTLKKKAALKKNTVSKKEGATRKAAKKAENKDMKKVDGRASAKSKTECKVARKQKKAATAIAINLADFTCPCCSKRCPLSKPKCGKGKASAKKKLEKVSKAA